MPVPPVAPTKNPEIIGGVVHGTVTPVYGAIKPTTIATYSSIAIAIGVKINGIAIRGLKQIGIPNKNGSLILNKEGTKPILPKLLSSADLAKNKQYMTIPNVTPEPVSVKN